MLCPGHKKCFWFCSETFCVRNKCFPVCAARETSWATMCPRLPGPLVLASIEKIYQKRKRVFDHISKHFERFIRNTLLRVILSTLFSMFAEMCSNTVFCVWYITFLAISHIYLTWEMAVGGRTGWGGDNLFKSGYKDVFMAWGIPIQIDL